MPYKVIDKILEWNASAEKRADCDYDKKICNMLVWSLASKDNVRTSNISEDVINFIKTCFNVRCDHDKEKRVGAIDMYIKELCAEKAKKKDEATNAAPAPEAFTAPEASTAPTM